jgi:hypothetical protein
MAGKAGTIRGITVGGPSYDAHADTNVSRKGSKNENTGVPTTGDTMIQQTRISQDAEGIKVAADADGQITLQEIADEAREVELSVTYADGKTWGCTGTINVDTHESETNALTIKMIPITDWAVY